MERRGEEVKEWSMEMREEGRKEKRRTKWRQGEGRIVERRVVRDTGVENSGK